MRNLAEYSQTVCQSQLFDQNNQFSDELDNNSEFYGNSHLAKLGHVLHHLRLPPPSALPCALSCEEDAKPWKKRFVFEVDDGLIKKISYW